MSADAIPEPTMAGHGADEAEDRVRAAVKDCVHCGFCLPACPTYSLWGEEMDSPRGRIYLVGQLLDGAPLTPAAGEHFDRCLGCMACMTACPSGVQYDQIIEAGREWTEAGVNPLAGGEGGVEREATAPRPLADRLTREAIFALFPYPRRLRAATAPLRLAQRIGAARLLARTGLVGRVAPAAEQALRLAPASRPAPPGRLPERVAALGSRRAVVGMLTGCVQSVFFPAVNAATARVLAAEGCDVVIPPNQGCCGALSLHSGRHAEATTSPSRTIELFEQAGVDAIVVNAAGCGSAMKDYAELLAADPAMAARAAALSAKVRDFSEFLAEVGPVAPRADLELTVAYHDACHLGHAQRITAQPRDLLRGIPGLKLAELGDGATCCGSAGIYNLVQPEAAAELGARKASAVRATPADLLVSANPGCALQITRALAADGGQVLPMAHIAEVIDASIRALPARSLLR